MSKSTNIARSFKYFAYGSNLNEKRIHINNPTAKRISAAKLKDYRLDFNYFSKRWNGNAATIVPDPSNSVWGAIWEINKCNEHDLDQQEGVGGNVYKILYVTVESTEGIKHDCKTYMLCELPSNNNINERPPSKIYLDTIISGAEESGLPNEYIEKLKKIPHNNYDGPVHHELERF